MSNVLRITTSTVGYDSQNTPPKSNMVTRPDTKVQAPVVPDQIVRPDARSDSAHTVCTSGSSADHTVRTAAHAGNAGSTCSARAFSGNAERNAAGSGPNDREYAGDIERQAAHAATEGRWRAVLSDGSAGVFESGF